MAGPLAAKIRAKYPGAYDDMDDAALEAAVLAKYPEYQDLAETPTEEPAAPEPSAWDRLKTAAYQSSPLPLFERKNLPLTGAALAAAATSGAAAPLLAPAVGAAMGGAGGEVLGQILDTIRGTRTEPDARAVLREGAIQGGLQGAGGLTGKVIGGVGRHLYRYALKPSKAIQNELPNVVDVGLREMKPVTSGGAKRGAAAREASKQSADALVADAAALGTPDVDLRTVVRGLRPARDLAKERVGIGKSDEVSEVAARARALRKQYPSRRIPLIKAQGLKRTAQDEADKVFDALSKGNVVPDMGGHIDKGVATGLRTAIEERVPGVASINRRTSELAGLTNALEDASTRNPGYLPTLMSSLIGGGGAISTGDLTPLLGAYGIQAMLSPRMASSAGIAASKVPPFLPDATRAAILAYLEDQE